MLYQLSYTRVNLADSSMTPHRLATCGCCDQWATIAKERKFNDTGSPRFAAKPNDSQSPLPSIESMLLTGGAGGE